MPENSVVLEVRTANGLLQVGTCHEPLFTHDSIIIERVVMSDPPGFNPCRMDLDEWFRKNQVIITHTYSGSSSSSATSWTAFYVSSSSISVVRKGLYTVSNLMLSIGGYDNG